MRRFVLLIVIIFIAGLAPLSTSALSAVHDEDKGEIVAFLTQLFKDRNAFIINRLPATIDKYYNKSLKASRYAYQMELRREKYLNTWADKRGLSFTAAEPVIRLTRFKKDGDLANVALVQSTKITYTYKIFAKSPQSFGVGTRHALTLKKIDGVWIVLREWYLDPLEENPDLIPESPAGFPRPSADSDSARAKNNGNRYNRERAVAYANKYAGLAWGAGNNNRYNQKYKDYTPLGGDCTNFVSQVLGDAEEGGGLRKTSAWRGGSRVWVQTDGLHHYLLYSGNGRLIAKGGFEDITQSSSKYPEGAVASLKPGDLIGYILHGDVDHFSVIVGHDVSGYPLVNSHTADRYRVPFDLGWDKMTKYILIHVND